MAAKKTSRAKEKRLLTWASRMQDAAQVCLAIITLTGVPVGAYVHLLNTINATRRESRDQLSTLEKKVDNGFSQVNADMRILRILIEREHNNEKNIQLLRDDLKTERSERVEGLRALEKLLPPRKP